METVIRQSIGIDIAKATFTACVGKYFIDGNLTLGAVATFENSKRGFNQLLKWSRKQCVAHIPTTYVMEATGVYYEPLAYHLHRLKLQVCVLLPNKVKHYAKSLNVKTKNDTVDARLIARLGAERTLNGWIPPAPVFRQLRSLTRLYTSLKSQRTAFTNQLHSVKAGEVSDVIVVKSLKSIISKLEKEIVKLEASIKELIRSEPWLQQKVEKLMTIKGVGFITIAVVLAETQGFELFGNNKQLASYAGYDVVERSSGSSVKGKTRISKKGNSRIRAALHFPALVAAVHNPELKATYLRINQDKQSKMIGATALQRKLLILMFTLWKNDVTYQTPHERVATKKQSRQTIRAACTG